MGHTVFLKECIQNVGRALTCSKTLEQPPEIWIVERNGTGTELVPTADFWNWNGTNSSFGEKNGMDRNSKIFGIGHTTAFTYLQW